LSTSNAVEASGGFAAPSFAIVPAMHSKLSVALTGVRDTMALAVGTTPFAVIFGTLAVTSGLTPLAALAMSGIVFAGSAQFISLALIGGGAALPVIWLTTFIVNLRHALYSATLQPVARDWPLPWRALTAFWLTDECFVVVEHRLQTVGEQDVLPYFMGSALFFYINWLTWTGVGALLGHQLPGLAALGLDFAMLATFAAMVAPQLRAPTPIAVALVAGIIAWLGNGLPYKFGLVLAALAGVTVGVVLDFWASRNESEETR
jgi:predicted branched-subunit amino acid permease